ncbi:hypothetical protein [Pseudalkalibacillus hwajinpoensis]|uniref:Uncharacterized protein n=1 Tax=Guptibacillus hwajinpoensis TaxID=208199 RepID=A0A4V5PYN1_9BACL|nr:hypothetical protein [Pseudalkalibacillus hwajinpoensis]TKD70788.1 hypothetical protein FBF83_09245 [Pseudalkalibacillus hwajinpoensis]
MENLKRNFIENHFTISKETTKSIEFEHGTSGEVIYLIPNKEITIILNPKLVQANQQLLDKSFGLNHSTSFRQFPKRQHTGKDLIHYGYSFKLQSSDELVKLLKII